MAPHQVALHHGDVSVEVSLAGGELRRWRVHGHELLWDADALWWPRSCPVLFPIVGRLRGGNTRIGGRYFEMGIHGFAGSQHFTPRSVHADQVTLGLTSNDVTRALYPFEFDLSLCYELQDEGLDVALCVTNLGRESMPFALGLHPGFRWPFSAPSSSGHAVAFEQAESPRVPVVTAEGLISDAWRAVDMCGSRLALAPSLFAHDALCFLNARSGSVRFESPDGAAIVLAAHNFPHWALWTKPGAPFLCIEAWTGHPDPHDFDGEFSSKPSMRHLAPGASSRHGLSLRFEAAPKP